MEREISSKHQNGDCRYHDSCYSTSPNSVAIGAEKTVIVFPLFEMHHAASVDVSSVLFRCQFVAIGVGEWKEKKSSRHLNEI